MRISPCTFGTQTETRRQISVSIPDDETSVKAEDIPLQILYEDSDMMAVNKPAGMVTHPAKGHAHGTLANAVVHKLQHSRTKQTKSNRMGLVHRLDKDTSGVLLIGKNREAAEKLAQQFKDRTISKVYRAIVQGKVTPKRGRIVGSLGRDFDSGKIAVKTSGRYSETLFKVLGNFGEYSYLEVYPRTGRTHQIRVHLSQIGHPVMGDTCTEKVRSGKAPDAPRLSIEFAHPRTSRRKTVSALRIS